MASCNIHYFTCVIVLDLTHSPYNEESELVETNNTETVDIVNTNASEEQPKIEPVADDIPGTSGSCSKKINIISVVSIRPLPKAGKL